MKNDTLSMLEGHTPLVPYLIVKDVDAELTFISEVFGFEVKNSMQNKEGHTSHAEAAYHGSVVMMGRANKEYPPMPCMMYLYVKDTDQVFKKALEMGARSIMEPGNRDYGNREAGLVDPEGIQWWIAHRLD